MPKAAFRHSLCEDIGVRSGLALTPGEILQALGADHARAAELTGEGRLRLQSEDYADAVGDGLFALGAADQPGMPTLATRFLKTWGGDWRSEFSLDGLLELEAIGNAYLRRGLEKRTDQAEVSEALEVELHSKPEALVRAFNLAMAHHLAHNPFFARTVRAATPVALRDLFESEKLPIDGDEIFDQRFINYLAQNPDRLDQMHWRQFEAMTGEWFQRQGYTVDLGPGRNDGGVDLRAWKDNVEPGTPPTIIIQCKREKRKVGRVVVKALYADLLHEQAEAGLVVTTTDLSPGTAKDCAARVYPITVANHAEVRRWVGAMRKPNPGIDLALAAADASLAQGQDDGA